MKFPACVWIPWAEKRTKKSEFFPVMVRVEIRYVEKRFSVENNHLERVWVYFSGQ